MIVGVKASIAVKRNNSAQIISFKLKSLKQTYTQLIKQEAKRLQFDYCGISKAQFLNEQAPQLEKWLHDNKHGQMQYMENYFDKRLNPTLLVDGAKSVISLLLIAISSAKIALRLER